MNLYILNYSQVLNDITNEASTKIPLPFISQEHQSVHIY